MKEIFLKDNIFMYVTLRKNPILMDYMATKAYA